MKQNNLSTKLQKPLPFTGREKPIFVPEWEKLFKYYKRKSLTLEEVSRHCLILGETGSGKTYSAMLPYIKVLLENFHSNDGYLPSALIIDPKFEISGEIEEWINNGRLPSRKSEDVIHINSESKYKVWFFEGAFPYKSFDEIIHWIKILNPNIKNFINTTYDPHWETRSWEIFMKLLKIDYMLYQKSGDINTLSKFRKLFYAMLKQNAINNNATHPNIKISEFNPENYFQWFQTFINYVGEFQHEERNNKKDVGKKSPFWILSESLVSNELSRLLGIQWNPADIEIVEISEFFNGIAQECRRIWLYYMGIMTSYINTLTNEDTIKYLGLCPYSPPQKNWVSIKKIMSDSKIIIFVPESRSEVFDFIGRAIKTLWFKYTFIRPNKKIPLLYIADEFQRFISLDPEYGEYNYIDRARAFRASCIFATQSFYALKVALDSQIKSHFLDTTNVLYSLLGNIATRFIFRTPDLTVKQWMIEMYPMTGDNNINPVSAVPPGALNIGECYVFWPLGRPVRGQVKLNNAVSDRLQAV